MYHILINKLSLSLHLETNTYLGHPLKRLNEPLSEVPVHDGDEDLVERVVLEGVQRHHQHVARQARRDQVGAAAGGQHRRHGQLRRGCSYIGGVFSFGWVNQCCVYQLNENPWCYLLYCNPGFPNICISELKLYEKKILIKMICFTYI